MDSSSKLSQKSGKKGGRRKSRKSSRARGRRPSSKKAAPAPVTPSESDAPPTAPAAKGRRKKVMAKKRGIGGKAKKSARGARPIRFHTYIRKIVKAQAGGRGMSGEAVDEVDNQIKGLLRLVVPTAVICSQHRQRKTLMSKDVAAALDVLLRGDFHDDVKAAIARVHQGRPAIPPK